VRRTILLAAAVLAAATWAFADGARPAAGKGHRHPSGKLAATLADARLATAKYATSLPAAQADGYQIITKMIPDMGFHFMNPKVTGFDVTKPPILVYEERGDQWQLGALEWVFTSKPKTTSAGGAVRQLRRRLPLRRRHLRPGRLAERLPEHRARNGRRLQLLAPRPGHPARLAVLPQPLGPLREHESARPALQRRLTSAPPRTGMGWLTDDVGADVMGCVSELDDPATPGRAERR